MRYPDPDRRAVRTSPDHSGARPSAQIIWLDEWRRKRRPRAIVRPRRLFDPPRLAPPPGQARIPIEVWLIMLIVLGAISGAVLVLMYYGAIP